MNSVGVFGKGFDGLLVLGDESRLTANSSISSMIVSMSKCEVFLDSFLLAALSDVAPFTRFLFKFSRPLLLLSSFLAAALMSSPSTDSDIGLKTGDVVSDITVPDLSKSSFTVVRQLFWETCN